MIKIIDVDYIEKHRLQLKFSNGEEYRIDLAPITRLPAYQILAHVEEFKQFGLVRGTLEWNEGLDIAPEYLFDLCLKQAGVKTSDG